jgi:lipopolysaccharide assembly outer membrane protein LptD (OstA)
MRNKGLQIYATLLLFSISSTVLHAQPISLKAKKMKSLDLGDHQGQLLTGDVSFEQSGSKVYCDRAEYDPKSETLNGFGNVKILNPDGAVVTGSQLFYDNKTNIARVLGDVVLKDDGLILKTPWIEYHTQTKMGWYGAGGFIQDKDTYLKSKRGRYDPKQKKLHFKDAVILENDDYLIQTDTLIYETDTKKAIFNDYTQINTQDEQIILNKGYYFTEKKQGYFTNGFTYVAKNKRMLCSDTAFLDKANEAGYASGNVWLYDSAENWILYGQQGAYRKGLNYAEMFGNALAINTEKDSFWIKADSLITEQGTTANSQITNALGNVKLLQGNSKSTAQKLTHFEKDSTIKLRGNPVLWDSATRMSGDSIDIYTLNNKIRFGSLYPKALIVNQEKSDFFSQIQGDSIYYSLDTQQHIEYSWVYRNGKSIYFISEDSAISSAFSVTCENMKFNFVDNRIEQVNFYVSPKGTLFPIDQLPEDKKRLDRFIWDIEKRPELVDFNVPFEPKIQYARYIKTTSIRPAPVKKSFFWFLKK